MNLHQQRVCLGPGIIAVMRWPGVQIPSVIRVVACLSSSAEREGKNVET